MQDKFKAHVYCIKENEGWKVLIFVDKQEFHYLSKENNNKELSLAQKSNNEDISGNNWKKI